MAKVSKLKRFETPISWLMRLPLLIVLLIISWIVIYILVKG